MRRDGGREVNMKDATEHQSIVTTFEHMVAGTVTRSKHKKGTDDISGLKAK